MPRTPSLKTGDQGGAALGHGYGVDRACAAWRTPVYDRLTPPVGAGEGPHGARRLWRAEGRGGRGWREAAAVPSRPYALRCGSCGSPSRQAPIRGDGSRRASRLGPPAEEHGRAVGPVAALSTSAPDRRRQPHDRGRGQGDLFCCTPGTDLKMQRRLPRGALPPQPPYSTDS
jgi:hypothetical protein